MAYIRSFPVTEAGYVPEEFESNIPCVLFPTLIDVCVTVIDWLIVAAAELATTMHELEADKQKLASDADALNVIFKEMIQMCLWSVFDV